MSTKTFEPSFGDPYVLLGVEQDATDSEISKAYRKLALKLHPDKQHGKSDAEKKDIAKRFHLVKEARVFLLEKPEERRRYDIQRESRQRRAQREAARENAMSERRKRMRTDLAAKEAAVHAAGKRQRQEESNKRDEAELDRLRKEGERLRRKRAEDQARKQADSSRKKRKEDKHYLEDRQIRLKWSRKRIKMSPSEDSIAKLMRRFGAVEQVEMIGSKGNAALVTFANPSSCQPCVNHFATSDEMRATFVGNRRDDEAPSTTQFVSSSSLPTDRDRESVSQRQMRQAMERERLARELEREENTSEAKTTHRVAAVSSAFPLKFPSAGLTGATPIEKLEEAERLILKGLLQV